MSRDPKSDESMFTDCLQQQLLAAFATFLEESGERGHVVSGNDLVIMVISYRNRKSRIQRCSVQYFPQLLNPRAARVHAESEKRV